VQTCDECGNHDMRAIARAGGVVHECGLCGATYGDRRAAGGAAAEREAAARGVQAAIWPLARALEQLPGFALGACKPGAAGGSPSVELLVTGAASVTSLENLSKSLRLAEGQLRCRWLLEARFEQALVVLLRVDGADASLRDAHLDVEVLAAAVDRDRRRPWWRQGASDPGRG
jgi:hypothetical protein